jgi:hypothetical protein
MASNASLRIAARSSRALQHARPVHGRRGPWARSLVGGGGGRNRVEIHELVTQPHAFPPKTPGVGVWIFWVLKLGGVAVMGAIMDAVNERAREMNRAVFDEPDAVWLRARVRAKAAQALYREMTERTVKPPRKRRRR